MDKELNVVATELGKVFSAGRGESLNIARCLTSRCAHVMNKCRTKTCPARKFRIAAKRECLPVLQQLGAQDSVCADLCSDTMMNMQKQVQNNAFFQTGDDEEREINSTLSTNRTAAFDSQFRADDTPEERLQRCVSDCRAKRAERDPTYKACVNSKYMAALSACMAASCAEPTRACVMNTCKIEIGSDDKAA